MALKALLVLCFVGAIVAQFRCPADCELHGECSNGRCVCTEPNYVGDDCSVYDESMAPGTEYHNHVDRSEWKYYTLESSSYDTITWTLTRSSDSGDCDLYIKNSDEYPTRLNFDERNISSGNVMTITIDDAEPSTYKIGVWGYRECDYELHADISSPCPNACNGHGECSSVGECTCNSEYVGDDCSIPVVVEGREYAGYVSDLFSWEYFAFKADKVYDSIEWTLTPIDSRDHNCQMYISVDRAPTLFAWDETEVGNTNEPISLEQSEIVAGHTYYMGVDGMFGFVACNFTASIRVTSPDSTDECPNSCSLHGKSDSCPNNKCSCKDGYSGPECEEYLPPLTLGQVMTGYAGSGAWNYYNIEENTVNSLKVTLTRTSSDGDVDLYVNAGTKPTRYNYTASDFSASTVMSVEIHEPTGYTWYIGVFGWEAASYSLVVAEDVDCECVHGNCFGGTTQCDCDGGWAGDLCDQRVKNLTSGVPAYNEIVFLGEWNYYMIDGTDSSAVSLTVKEHGDVGVAWVFVNYDVFPTTTDYAYNDKNHHDSNHQITYHTKEPQTGSLYIGVYGSPYIPEVSGANNVTYDIECWVSGF